MNGFKKLIYHMKLRKKLILFSYLFVTPILIIISVYLFRRNYRISMEAERSECIRSMHALSNNVDSALSGITDIGTYICINKEITNVLSARDPAALNEDALLWYHEAPMQMIQDMMALGSSVKTLAIYPENGVMPYLRCMDHSAYNDSIREIRKSEEYETACRSVGKYVFRRTEKDYPGTYKYNQNPKINVYREIYDMSRKHKLGYMIIGAGTELFDDICRAALRSSEEAVYVLSPDEMILSGAGSIDSMNAARLIKELYGTGAENKTYVTASGYTVYREAGTGGVTVYRFVPLSKNDQILKQIITSGILLLAGLLIAFLPILLIMTSIITRPLKKLRHAMRHFKEGDFTQRVEVDSMDEVGEVSVVFNDMVKDMKELIDTNYVIALKEKESELDALQAQINPHFLYNTLDTLYWKCIDADNDEIGEDILALSQLFRLVLNRGNSIIPVSDEIKLLENYMHIQHARFGNRLSYNIGVRDDIMNEQIPKLILQPFVENSVLHGFEKGKEDFRLTIQGYRKNGKLEFIISDNGIGMSEEQIASLLTDQRDAKRSGHIGGYAVYNVYERLKLLYHDDFQLDITGCEGNGTTVHLVLGSMVRQEERNNSDQRGEG